MKEKILNEIVNNTIKLIEYKTIKENYNLFCCQNQYSYDILFIDRNYGSEEHHNEL